MNKVYVIDSGRLYDLDAHCKTIGGQQTYIGNLLEVCRELGWKTYVVQTGKRAQKGCVDGHEIIQYAGYKVLDVFENTVKQRLLPNLDLENDLFIFATDINIFKKLTFKRSIAIQHGVFWDIPSANPRNPLRVLLSKARRAYQNIKAFDRVQKVVCVDYNFVNWLRTQTDRPLDKKIAVIPNFTEIAPINSKPTDRVNIMFARRFYGYRGTRIFAAAIKRLLDEGANISVTLAGTGEDEQWLRDRLGSYANVEFITFTSGESLAVHADKHIAVVPTVGSEGTSLSLLEAMSSQCAVVCSNVGGMTNIVIDGYNGLMITPNEDELYDAMKKLVDDENLRRRLAEKAYETVQNGFSLEKWRSQWRKVLEEAIR